MRDERIIDFVELSDHLLCQVIERSSGSSIQEHQVVVVAYLSLQPFLHHDYGFGTVVCLDLLLGLCQQRLTKLFSLGVAV